jgi:hypothetical protein
MADGYDPRMLQMAQMGVRMMGPQAGPFDRTNQPKQWWDQPLPSPQRRNDDNPSGQPANQPANPSKQQPSLLQMLMLGGPASYSGTPRPQAAGASPWGWLGSMGMPGGAGWGGGGGTPG